MTTPRRTTRRAHSPGTRYDVAFAAGRRGALYGIGLAIVLAVTYLLVSSIFIAFGTAELLPAALAAWATNIPFTAAALTMVFTVRT